MKLWEESNEIERRTMGAYAGVIGKMTGAVWLISRAKGQIVFIDMRAWVNVV